MTEELPTYLVVAMNNAPEYSTPTYTARYVLGSIMEQLAFNDFCAVKAFINKHEVVQLADDAIGEHWQYGGVPSCYQIAPYHEDWVVTIYPDGTVCVLMCDELATSYRVTQ